MTAEEFFSNNRKTASLPRKYNRADVDLYFVERPELAIKRFVAIGGEAAGFLASLGIARAAALLDPETWTSSGKSASRAAVIKSDSRRLTRLLSKLGPTFVKLGQVLATREDLVGPVLAEALQELQESAPPFDDATARGIIAEELGKDLETVFEYLSSKPVAAASLGQVYLGRLRTSGQVVAVKVENEICSLPFFVHHFCFVWFVPVCSRVKT